jgi:hypothetical protein
MWFFFEEVECNTHIVRRGGSNQCNISLTVHDDILNAKYTLLSQELCLHVRAAPGKAYPAACLGLTWPQGNQQPLSQPATYASVCAFPPTKSLPLPFLARRSCSFWVPCHRFPVTSSPTSVTKAHFIPPLYLVIYIFFSTTCKCSLRKFHHPPFFMKALSTACKCSLRKLHHPPSYGCLPAQQCGTLQPAPLRGRPCPAPLTCTSRHATVTWPSSNQHRKSATCSCQP